MMNSRDIVEEILKRKETYIRKRREKVKKTLAVMTVILLFTVIGGTSFMISVHKKEAPSKVPKITMGVGETTNDDTSYTENTTDTESSVNSDTESKPQSDTETDVKTHGPTETSTEEPTEPKPTEPKPTEPKPTEPQPTEPPVTDPDPTEGLVDIGKLESQTYYPKINFPSGSGGGGEMGFDSWEDEPTVSYELIYKTISNKSDYPIEYTFIADDYYFINAVNLPLSLNELSIKGKYLAEERPCIERLVEAYCGVADEQITDQLFNVVDEQITNMNFIGYFAPEKDPYGTEFRVKFHVARIKNGENTYETTAYATLTNTTTHVRDDFTYDEIYEYVISLPHFKAMLDYAGIEEYIVERKYERYADDRYYYEFIFIPKTDDVSLMQLYRKSKFVKVHGEILSAEYGQPQEADIQFTASDVPYSMRETYKNTKDFYSLYEDAAKEFEAFGVRDYFEKNYVCVLSDDGMNLDFYLKFTNGNGDIVLCKMWECGYRADGSYGASGPVATLRRVK